MGEGWGMDGGGMRDMRGMGGGWGMGEGSESRTILSLA